MNKIKKVIKVLRERGLKVLLSKAVNLIAYHARRILAPFYVKFFILRKKEEIIKKIADFHSGDRDKIFNFIQKKYFHIFSAMQIKSELMELLKIVESRRPKYVLDVGTANGGTFFCFLKLSSEDATLASIDLPGEYGEWRVPLFEAFKKENQQLFLFRKDSHDSSTLASVKEAFGGKELDFLFIDGDHTYEGVKKDFEMYGPLVKKGGIIAFHDIVNGLEEHVGGVPRFWREIKPGYEHKEFVKDWNQGGYGIGVLFA